MFSFSVNMGQMFKERNSWDKRWWEGRQMSHALPYMWNLDFCVTWKEKGNCSWWGSRQAGEVGHWRMMGVECGQNARIYLRENAFDFLRCLYMHFRKHLGISQCKYIQKLKIRHTFSLVDCSPRHVWNNTESHLHSQQACSSHSYITTPEAQRADLNTFGLFWHSNSGQKVILVNN